jgi:hypothetical protein
MNGRIYDPTLGVDSFVDEGSQRVNPHSYIEYNPLSGTNPTDRVP